MTEEERAIFASTLVGVCADMWKTADAPAGPEVGAGSQMMVASIGLAGSVFRGALVALATPDFFRGTYPPELRKPVVRDEDLMDWAGEVSNQLLGRIKNRLCRLGLDFNISTPTVVRGDQLTVGAPAPSAVKHTLAVAGARLDLFFDIAHNEGKALLPATGPVVAASLEGEGLLF